MFAVAFPLALCLALVSGGRDYRLRAPPSITHSVVNLGKMELNVYLNSKPNPESPKTEYEFIHPSKPLHSLRSESGECPCQQNRFKNRNLDLHSPPDMLSKILMNNDLFKDPTSSSLCCSSLEQIQEEFYMELNPNTGAQPMPVRSEVPAIPQLTPIVHNFPQLPSIQMDKQLLRPMQFLPFILDSFYKGAPRPKPKALEIILFPTKKAATKAMPTKRASAPVTPEIQAVGDKKTTMVYDLLAANSSVKKDLNQEVAEHLKDMDVITDKTTQTIQNNTL